MEEHDRAHRQRGAEEASPQAVSFVIRIWKQPGPTGVQYRGWVEHVQSGSRTAFLGLDHLPSAIAGYVGLPGTAIPSWRHRWERWRARLSAWFVGKEEV